MKRVQPGRPPAAVSLDPSDWSDLRAQAHLMLDDMLGAMETIREQPVWQPIPHAVQARFREGLPVKPSTLADVHQQFMTSILPYTARNAHPGFMGWVQGGGTPVGMLAEMLAAGLNANLGGRDQIPIDVERQVTDWVRTLFGFPAAASGLFVTGTSMANFLAVVIARDNKLGYGVRRDGVEQSRRTYTAYASTAVHGCIGRALDFAGLGSDALRLVPVDSRQRIDLEALAKSVAADRRAGLTPFLAIGTAGTVDTGAVDDLAGLAALCAQEQLWLHVDGAYGALAMLAPELAALLNGIGQADSLAFDFHKWAQVPYDAGFLLVRDGVLHQQAFRSACNYLKRDEQGMSAGSPWPCDLGVDLSRSFRALKTWATLKVYGTEAIGKVIYRTCELARYLESLVLASPELELMASVELNIVCFRYRFVASTCSATGELCDRLNRQIVVALQESGAVAPSTTLIAGRLCIRAAIVNHRTSLVEVDTLVHATIAEGRKLRPPPLTAESEKGTWQPWLERDAQIRALDDQLAPSLPMQREVEVALRVERATLLAEMGRTAEARTDYFRVLELEPAHLTNLLGLGRLLVATGRRKAAQMVYAEAVKYYPEDVVCRVNLGSALLEGDDPQAARLQYEAALRIDPGFPQAHGGMYYALIRLGEPEAAASHQRRSFGKQSLFQSPYRGATPPIPVLLLVSSTGGNVPIEKLLDDCIYETSVLVADFYDPGISLPQRRFVFNGIGDPDVAADALVAAERLLKSNSAPLLNAPCAVRLTGRCHHAGRLKGVPNLICPTTVAFPATLLAEQGGPTVLAERGFRFPLLLRRPGFHMGKHFVRVESPQTLVAAVAEVSGHETAETELLAIEYLDACGADGCWRKYRVMMVGENLYPLHLAISTDWKIHYFSADMADRPDHRAEEAKFLADMPSALGSKAMSALKQVQAVLGLDYGGIDFGLNQQGDVLLFEANATMVVQQPDSDERWDYRRTAVEQIHAAVRQLFKASAESAQPVSDAYALVPPSTVKFVPVMYEDSGPATKATSAATSSTRP